MKPENEADVYAFNQRAAMLALEVDLVYFELLKACGVKSFTIWRKRL